MGLFDELLGQVEEADRAVFQKYPKVAERIDKNNEFVDKWELWRRNNWDEEAQMTKQAAEAIRARDAEIEALKLLQAGDMDWDQIKGNIDQTLEQFAKARKFATADDLKKTFETEITPKLVVKSNGKDVPLAEYAQNLERGMEFTYAHTAHMPLQHFQEFGTPMKIEELFTHMREKGIAKFEDGYESFVAPKRKAKADAEFAEREAALKKREDDLKDAQMRKGSLPDDPRGAAPEMTALTMRIAAHKKVDLPEGTPKLTPGELGSGTATQDAYQAYLKDQANGTKPMVQ